MFLVFVYDFHSPFYIASRVGRGGKSFKMIKLRSMKINADKSGVASTANDDNRITPVGKIIRKFKFDELSQLINVFLGSMSLVGPRPQVAQDVSLYTEKEKNFLLLNLELQTILQLFFLMKVIFWKVALIRMKIIIY